MKTHWKKQFNYDYLGSYSLPEGDPVILTMAATKKELIIGTSGKKEEAFVCYFKEKLDWVKPMILNRTNCKTIEKIYGTPYVEDWTGKQITIYIQSGVRAFGDVVDALRIKKEKPKLPDLIQGSKDFDNCKKALANGYKIEDFKKKYTLSNEVEKELLK